MRCALTVRCTPFGRYSHALEFSMSNILCSDLNSLYVLCGTILMIVSYTWRSVYCSHSTDLPIIFLRHLSDDLWILCSYSFFLGSGIETSDSSSGVVRIVLYRFKRLNKQKLDFVYFSFSDGREIWNKRILQFVCFFFLVCFCYCWLGAKTKKKKKITQMKCIEIGSNTFQLTGTTEYTW